MVDLHQVIRRLRSMATRSEDWNRSGRSRTHIVEDENDNLSTAAQSVPNPIMAADARRVAAVAADRWACRRSMYRYVLGPGVSSASGVSARTSPGLKSSSSTPVPSGYQRRTTTERRIGATANMIMAFANP